MIKNYIFDFGRVLIHFDPESMVRACTDDPEAVSCVTPVLFDRLYWDRLDDGTITDEELICAVKERLPERFHKIAENAYANWYRNCPGIPGMKELLWELKEKGVGLYLLSNISIGFAEGYHKVPHLMEILEPFDGLVFSGRLHMAKPDTAIFHYLLSQYHLNARECLFIDDSRKNLDAAEKVGISTYLFDGSADFLRAFLEQLS